MTLRMCSWSERWAEIAKLYSSRAMDSELGCLETVYDQRPHESVYEGDAEVVSGDWFPRRMCLANSDRGLQCGPIWTHVTLG